MAKLVALDLPGGPGFVRALIDVWDAGDAVLPIDQRLPPPARQALLDAARPSAIIDDTLARRPLRQGAPGLDQDDALVIATSGTTGTPGLVVHTHGSLRAHAEAVHDHLGVQPGSDRWLACLPLAHIGGLGVVLRSVLTGVPVDVLPGFDATTVKGSAEQLGTTLVSLVPTALDRIDPDSFRWVVLGGSGDSRVRPPNVVHTYGLTESGGGVVYDGVPLSGVEVRLGAEGEICLQGPMLARGRRRPDGTVAPIVDEAGWFVTGDLGRWDDGRLVVLGRRDHVIITGAEKVFPELVEVAIGSHPAVAEVAVVGRPDPEWGQRVTALVVPADATTPPTLQELRDHVRRALPAYAAPRDLDLVERLPRTGLGKIRRADLH